MSGEPIAWRFISNAKGAKWTVQKNFPTEVAKWAGYTVEPCYSADAIAAKDTALSEMRAELDRVGSETCGDKETCAYIRAEWDAAVKKEQDHAEWWKARAAAAEAELERARKALEIGRQLANAAFNIHQKSAVDARSLQTLKEVQLAWDESLLSAARALAPSIQDEGGER